ncbi:CDP-glycerol glycerophosphotransferase family protein [Luteimicrobium xylanilyticum]|uniref:Uncharacterized protein n=1 Tax=Luteimicrobium xylanilyticum TaxID=1133546 RepID=A0A5P9QCA3_9MICO|nr:hypothetical protein KDY119_02607 [Luteimicrobium xylanilyticum]
MVWRRLRRWGLVPSGQPDLLGEDDAATDLVLSQQVVVFFADPPGALYQLEQWFETFRAVDDSLGLVIVLQDSRTARAVRAAAPDLKVLVLARPSTFEAVVERGAPRLVLYVNHNPANFTVLRLAGLVHVSLLHGDSDKAVSASNQLKGYDYAFVAGQAAVDRIGRELVGYDAEVRCLVVGRPQVDAQRTTALSSEVVPREVSGDGPITVLYAPTWEGAQPSVCYGSVVSHGEALVRALLDDGGFHVVYRPHPLTGARAPEHAAADRSIREIVQRAGAPHRTDAGVNLGVSFAAADVLISDVSGVAVDWLATGRPQLMTVPHDPKVRLHETPLRAAVPGLTADDAASAGDAIRSLVADGAWRSEQTGLRGYYLGDVSPGAATRRFVEACVTVVADREQARAARSPVSNRQNAPHGA